MPALRQAGLIFRPASRSAWKSRRIAAIWSGLGRFRMGRSLALCQLYDSHYGWTRFWGAGHLGEIVPVLPLPPPAPPPLGKGGAGGGRGKASRSAGPPRGLPCPAATPLAAAT